MNILFLNSPQLVDYFTTFPESLVCKIFFAPVSLISVEWQHVLNVYFILMCVYSYIVMQYSRDHFSSCFPGHDSESYDSSVQVVSGESVIFCLNLP